MPLMTKRKEQGGRGAYQTDDVYTLRVGWDGPTPMLGQFFQLQPSNTYLKRPISVSGFGDGYVDLTVRIAGEGTKELVMREVGESIELFGPLGHGYEWDETAKRILVIGGGIGVAPQLPLVKKAKKNGTLVDVVLGFRGAPYMVEEFFEVADHLSIATELEQVEQNALPDLIQWYMGQYVTSAVASYVACHHYDQIFICGPDPMLRSLALMLTRKGYDPQLLMEERFACGVGACLVCTCEVESPVKYARVCTDGPMFYSSEMAYTSVSPRNDRFLSPSGTSSIVSSNEPGSKMGLDSRLEVDFNGLWLPNPITVASGTFGFGKEYDQFYDIGQLGAIAVKGLTLHPKEGNEGRRVIELPAGMINSVGLQNPGVEFFITHELPYLKQKGVPIIANINGSTLEEYEGIAEIIQESSVDAVELNISCPNVKAGGMAFGTDPVMVAQVVRAVRQKVSKHLMVKLSPNVTDIKQIARICEQEGADGLSLINTVTGMDICIERKQKTLKRGFGGMSGPTIRPIALKAVHDVSSVVAIPVLGMGGISSINDVIAFLMAGASAVAVGTAMFRDPMCPFVMLQELKDYLTAHQLKSVQQLTGLAEF